MPALANVSDPVIAPVLGSIFNVGGNPVAVKVTASSSGSWPTIGSVTLAPSAFVWSPGFVSSGGLFGSLNATSCMIHESNDASTAVAVYVPTALTIRSSRIVSAGVVMSRAV